MDKLSCPLLLSPEMILVFKALNVRIGKPIRTTELVKTDESLIDPGINRGNRHAESFGDLFNGEIFN